MGSAAIQVREYLTMPWWKKPEEIKMYPRLAVEVVDREDRVTLKPHSLLSETHLDF